MRCLLDARLLLPLAVVSGSLGCHLMESHEAITQESILRAAKPSAEAVTLDIYWVRLPHTSDGSDGGLWNHVNEDRLTIDVRRRLAENGLRAGVIGSTPPDLLLRLLDPDGAGELNGDGAAELRRTGVVVRTRQLRAGQELPLNASPTLDEATLLLGDGEDLSERTFAAAQGVYVVEVARADDDRTWLSLLPTVRHGSPRLSFSHDETGVISHGTMVRDTEAFPDLAMSSELAPGEILLVTNLPNSGSLLGGLLHAPATDAACERKAMLLRIADTPASQAFLPDDEG
ncbi:MAG: hypothetical protein AAF589_00880 [Planctomycetota bacterium]